MESSAKLVDLAEDKRWLQAIDSLVQKEDWSGLWSLAQTTRPIWSIRILKFLAKRNWTPAPDEQPGFFQELSSFAAKCNEFQLPTPDNRPPRELQIDIAKPRIATARITQDGEYLFVMDEKCSAIETRRMDDLSALDRIRLDVIAGKKYAVLGMAISDWGDKLAVLKFDQSTRTPAIHLYELDDGVVTSDRWIRWTDDAVGTQVPRMCFSGGGDSLVLLTGDDEVSVWDLRRDLRLRKFVSKPKSPDVVSRQFHYSVNRWSHPDSWKKFGRRAIVAPESRSLACSFDGERIVTTSGDDIVVADGAQPFLNVHCDTGKLSLSPDGTYLLLNDNKQVLMHSFAVPAADRPSFYEDAFSAYCNDPLACLAVNSDSSVIAVSMSHSRTITAWHLPDGRVLGTMHGLARDVLVDFRFTSGGSIVVVTRGGLVQTWEADSNGNAWPWSIDMVFIAYQSVDISSVDTMKRAQEMRRRGWLSPQESNMLDLAIALMQHRLNLDIEIDVEMELPGDVYDIEID